MQRASACEIFPERGGAVSAVLRTSGRYSSGLDDEQSLRDTFRVEFIAPDGTPESGVDGGGLFKAKLGFRKFSLP